MKYTIRKPTVGDLRSINASEISESEMPFKLAERCILADGKPIGEEGLNNLPVDVFEGLMAEINQSKKA